MQSSRTLGEVIRRLGLPVSGGNYRQIAARLRQAGVDTSHFGSMSIRARCAAIPHEVLAALVAECTSVAQILTKLGFPTEGRPHQAISQRIRALGIDTLHLRGRGWSRGETKKSHPSVAKSSRNHTWTDDQVFVENSPPVGGQRITPRLLAMGWSYCCAWHRRVARKRPGPSPRSHQRHQQRQPSRQSPALVPELPLANRHLRTQAPLVGTPCYRSAHASVVELVDTLSLGGSA